MDTLDNQPFMALEWIAGEEGKGADLRGWLRHGPLELRTALDFCIDICRGLIHAQEKQPGLVHRDLKPENIMVAQGPLAKITDFGLAEIIRDSGLELDADTDAAETDGMQSIFVRKGIAGTPAYMPPEQWRGEALDLRADIYALGCVLYEMLTGHCPYDAITLDSLRHQHLAAPIPKLTNTQSLPDALNVLLARCLAKRRDERFATADDLMQQLLLIYEECFAELPKAAPHSGEFTAIDYSIRGNTYSSLQRFDEAMADHNQAIQLDPTLAFAYVNRGNTYSDLHRYFASI
jgi:serine/threonine-protein kinase